MSRTPFLPRLRDWPAGTVWPSGEHLQEPVDALRAIGADAAYNQPTNRDLILYARFIGTIVSRGPNKEADYNTEQYWVKRSYLDAGKATDPLVFKDDPTDPVSIYTVTNRPEAAARTHGLKVGQIVLVEGWLDHSNPQLVRWFMSESVLQVGTFQLSSRITTGLYNGRTVKGSPTSVSAFVGIGSGSFPQTGETVSATEDVLIEYLPDGYVGAAPPLLGSSGAFVQGYYTGGMSSEATPRPVVRVFAVAGLVNTLLLKYVGDSARAGLVLVNECAPIAFPFPTTGAGLTNSDVGTDFSTTWTSAAYAIDLKYLRTGTALGVSDLARVFTGRWAGQWQISAGPPATYGSVYTIQPS